MKEHTHTGGCHCGAVRFRARINTTEAFDCNCSICTKKGFLHVFVVERDFELLSGQDQIATYTFGTGVAQHYFCRVCGVSPYYVPRSHPEDFDINLRCLDGDDVMQQFEIKPFDGKNWEKNVRSLPPAQES